MINKLKQLAAIFLKRRTPGKDALIEKPEDIDPENTIHSGNVSKLALKGRCITVMNGAWICDHSQIDSYTYIGINTLISKTKIGRYNSIANNVNIGPGEHPITDISTSSFINQAYYEDLTMLDCVITHDVWIGSGATIRRGVTLGIGCVVGANSFVNKDVPPFAVVGGVPAKILKYRFDQNKIDLILSSEWWTYDLPEAMAIVKKLETEN